MSAVIRRPSATGHSLVVGTLALATLTGCGPRVLLKESNGLPEVVAGRKLWHTPQGYIYARNETVAGETDGWIKDVAGHISRTYKGQLGAGLVIVTDTEDPEPAVASLDELQRLEELMPARAAASQPSRAERRRKLEESGMTERMARQVAIVPLDDLALSGLAMRARLPADVEWRLCCPSNRLAAHVTREFAPTAVERKKGKAFAIMAAPFMPLATAEAAKVFSLARDTAAFSLWAQRQDSWDSQQRESQTRRYMKERALIISPMLSLAIQIASKPSE